MEKITPHVDYKRFEELWLHVVELQSLASNHGIDDIFQDNGGKVLQTLLLLALKDLPGRVGNDAFDEDGNEYELKTVNMNLTFSISTHHHMNPGIIDKYRNVTWIFSIFEGIQLTAIYSVRPIQLEHLFEKWSAKYYDNGEKELNNPKIPLRDVVANGKLLYGEVPYIGKRPKGKMVKKLDDTTTPDEHTRQPTAAEESFNTLFD